MPDLIAQGPRPEHRWRRTLPAEQDCLLGRTAEPWSAAWDPMISRRHATLRWSRARLQVRRLPDSRNPIFFRGETADNFSLEPGEHFVIGGTTFRLSDDRVTLAPARRPPISEQTFTAADLRQAPFVNAQERLDLLRRVQELVSTAGSDAEINARLTTALLTGIRHAQAVAIVRAADPGGAVEVLHWDRRLLNGGDFEPSLEVICEALAGDQSVSHTWPAADSGGGSAWAFCVPVAGPACRGWALYVEGESLSATPADLRDDLKFAELVATTLSHVRESRLIERSRTSLSQFFPPFVLEAIAEQDAELALAPREADVAVLFCDLRGFSRHSEQSASDLLELLKRVSNALGVMTGEILRQGGVVGDFHGDAAMGFWGWPLAQADAPLRACRAALEIRRHFAAFSRERQHPLADFHVGIGIASGRAVAGKIGTADQVKVTVFGPVVNRAARLESLTRQIGTPILLDEATAAAIAGDLPADVARLRRLAAVRPYGFDSTVTVFELLPPVNELAAPPDADLQCFAAARQAFEQGDWFQAESMLAALAAHDPAAGFLRDFIASHHGHPPPAWPGAIDRPTK